jgi:hypothetical protein
VQPKFLVLWLSKMEAQIARGDKNAPKLKKTVHPNGLIHRSMRRTCIGHSHPSRRPSRLAHWM